MILVILMHIYKIVMYLGIVKQNLKLMSSHLFCHFYNF